MGPPECNIVRKDCSFAARLTNVAVNVNRAEARFTRIQHYLVRPFRPNTQLNIRHSGCFAAGMWLSYTTRFDGTDGTDVTGRDEDGTRTGRNGRTVQQAAPCH